MAVPFDAGGANLDIKEGIRASNSVNAKKNNHSPTIRTTKLAGKNESTENAINRITTPTRNIANVYFFGAGYIKKSYMKYLEMVSESVN